jgi:hypothetical protein
MKILQAIVLATLFASCSSSETKKAEFNDSASVKQEVQPSANTLTDAEKAEGWQLLYDGSTTRGWHVYLNKTDGSAWKSVDGTLLLDPSKKDGWQTVGGGDLVTDSSFENFHLSLEWMISENGNSGIIFTVQEDPKYEHTWHTGPEMQVLDNKGHSDGKIVSHRAGDLYDLIVASKEAAKGPMRWNKADVRLENGKLDLFMNGEQVVTVDMKDKRWRELIEGSKFKAMPDFGKFTSGRIALQDHGDSVWYRNIKIRRL